MAVPGNFFAEKREWSKLKDQILDHYLAPYLAKVTFSGRPTRIADCFAGRGRFDDGSPGSPLIIAAHVARQLDRTTPPDLKAIFIEQKYATELEANLADAPGCEVIAGDYEGCVTHFLAGPLDRDRNYFFYVDPYGIKSLDFAHFARLKQARFRSLEMLVNLNTTGFLREGCRLLKLDRAVPDWADTADPETDGRNTTQRMGQVAGGDYWQGILDDFQAGKLDFHHAEEAFTAGYVQRLGRHLEHVVSIPIKERSHHMPKYRLVFATDYHDGLFLMADEMNAAWRRLLDHETRGQLYLFDEKQLDAMRGKPIEEMIADALHAPLGLRDLLIALIRTNGIAHTTADYKNAIKEREGTMFAVTRDPATTPTGRKSTSMDHNKFKITIATRPHTPTLLNW
jgi:three-Cys-motif partner protein